MKIRSTCFSQIERSNFLRFNSVVLRLIFRAVIMGFAILFSFIFLLVPWQLFLFEAEPMLA